MSTTRRMFEDPRNTYIIENNDPGAFDKRFAGRPGVHREQQCCRNCAPVWQTHLVRDWDDPSSDNRTAYREMRGIEVEDMAGESDNNTGNNHKGMVWVEGPQSGYKPDFISAAEWMAWQSVYWIPSPNPRPDLPNPPRWARLPGERKIRPAGTGDYEFLWCQKCETWLEGAWSDILDVLPAAARGIAMVASYVPVYGTALSMVINTTVSLAEGQSIDQALVDNIGRALPGQPASGMVYQTSVSIAKGERLDHAALDITAAGLGLDKSVTDVLKAADEALYHIATGQNLADVAYGTISQYLPAEAQQGMQLARRFINGENVPEMILSQAEQVVADAVKSEAEFLLSQARAGSPADLSAAEAKVNAMFNQYAVEFGYQMAIDRLSDDARRSMQHGMTGGAALAGPPQQFVGTFGSIRESNVAVNSGYAAQGQALLDSGIRYRLKPVSDILKQRKFAITIDFYESLNSVWTKRAMDYEITDAWRRGFIVAIGVCQGCSERGPGQLAVYQTLAEAGSRDGFDAGQAVQFNRTLAGDLGVELSATVVAVDHAAVLSAVLNAGTTSEGPQPVATANLRARAHRPKVVPNFVGLTRSAITASAQQAGIPITDWVAYDETDTRAGGDLREMMLAYTDQNGVDHPGHSDDQSVATDQEPLADSLLSEGEVVKIAWALAPGIAN